MDLEERCGTCTYSRPHGTDVATIECHRQPPTLLLQPSRLGGGETLITLFPVTKASNWCGEWRRRLGVQGTVR